MTNQSDIKKLAEQMAGSMKSFDDIKDFQKQLMQSFIDTALEAEMEDHLGYPKHEKADKPNKRNGHTKKTVRSDTGDLEISTPRDRDGDFEPPRLYRRLDCLSQAALSDSIKLSQYRLSNSKGDTQPIVL